jgi:hypothetical protein
MRSSSPRRRSRGRRRPGDPGEALRTSGRIAGFAPRDTQISKLECRVLLICGTRDCRIPHTGAQILLEARPRLFPVVDVLTGRVLAEY